MREDIMCIDELTGERRVSIYRATGTGYENGWFTNCHCRYRFFVGARNTKKSYVMLGYEPVAKILSDERRNILVVRQNDCDNRQSTYESISRCIYDLGLENEFEFRKNPLIIEYKATHQQIIFRGLNNPTSLNSITFAHGYLTDVYIEEAFEVESYADFRKLDGSLRGKLPAGLFLQITCCMNAWNQDCWIYQEFFKGRLEDDYNLLNNPDITFVDYKNEDYIGNYGKGLYLHKSTYKINEFRDTEVYDRSMLEMRDKAPLIYQVEGLGMWGNATEVTYTEFNESCQVSIQEIMQNSILDFAIGIDTGLSSGDGRIKKVLKGQDVNKRVKSATTMQLVGITEGFTKILNIDEYFHSNDPNYSMLNTDTKEKLTEPQLMDTIIHYILKWIKLYASDESNRRTITLANGEQKRVFNNLMRGTINVYVDSADLGFRQGLEIKAREYGLYNVVFMPATKISIQSRIDFSRVMMSYGDFLVCKEHCPNLIREFRNARKGEKGEPREDTDDHAINAHEYAWAPFRGSLVRWKNFKEH